MEECCVCYTQCYTVTPCCYKPFCNTCSISWFNNNDSCPNCRHTTKITLDEVQEKNIKIKIKLKNYMKIYIGNIAKICPKVIKFNTIDNISKHIKYTSILNYRFYIDKNERPLTKGFYIKSPHKSQHKSPHKLSHNEDSLESLESLDSLESEYGSIFLYWIAI